MNQRYLVDKTGTLYFYPPELAVPSSAKVTLYKPAGGDLQAEDDATADSVSTTVAAAASRGARSFTVASASGIAAGVRYLLEEGGDIAAVTVDKISGTTIYIEGRLPFDLTDSSTFKGYRLTYSLTTTHTDDKADNYRADWQYTADGVTQYHSSYFDVVADKDWYSTTWKDCTDMYGWLQHQISEEDFDGEDLLATAWKFHVVPMMVSKGLDPAQVKDKDQLKPIHIECVVLVQLGKGGPADLDREDAQQEKIGRRLEQLTSSLTLVDVDDDLAVDDGETNVIRTGIRCYR